MSKPTCDYVSYEDTTSIGAYIGDICYVLDDYTYDHIWGTRNNYADGEIEIKDGESFAVFSTGIGDGSYPDTTYKYSFDVDAGVIGMVKGEVLLKYGKKELIHADGTLNIEKLNRLGAFIKADGETSICFEAETVNEGWDRSTHYTIGVGKTDIEIYTDPRADPDYEDDEDEDEEDDYEDDEEDDEEEDK